MLDHQLKSLQKEIIGHTTQRALLKNLLIKDRFPHALLLCGQAGIGKRLIALEVAEEILTRSLPEEGEMTKSKALKLIRHGEHPDLYFLTPKADKKSIGVEEIRELQERLALTPYYRTGACILIEDAEKMSIQATNCLLKTLEEPTENRYFILLSSAPHLIAPTIVSRSQKLQLGPLNQSEIRLILERLSEGSSGEHQLDEITHLLAGSLELLSLSPEERCSTIYKPSKDKFDKALSTALEINSLKDRFSSLYTHQDNIKRFVSESAHLLSSLEKEGKYTNSQVMLALISFYRSALRTSVDRNTRLRISEALLKTSKTWEEIKSRNLNLNLQLGSVILNDTTA